MDCEVGWKVPNYSTMQPMKRKYQRVVELLFARPMSANINGAISKRSLLNCALKLLSVKAVVLLLFYLGKSGYFTGHIRRQTPIKVRQRAFTSGLNNTELRHEFNEY